MSRIPPLAIEELDLKSRQTIAAGQSIMGFTTNDGLIMARHPELLKSFLGLVEAIYQPGTISIELKKLLGLMTSHVSGCQYCQAHTSFGALKAGVAQDKILKIWEYETNSIFDDAERVALDVARYAALIPNAVTDDQFERLKQHFTEEQIVELVGVISLFGFLNRWNATFATEIEQAPQIAMTQLTMTSSTEKTSRFKTRDRT